MDSESDFLSSYECIQTFYKKAMREVDTAIGHEENNRTQDAIAAYERGVELINGTFQISVGLPDSADEVASEWNEACRMIQQLKNVKTEIVYRLKVLRGEQSSPVDVGSAEEANEAMNNSEAKAEHPNSNIDITSGACGLLSTYQEVLNGLRNVIGSRDCDVSFDTLFQAPARVYKIQNSGKVTTLAGDTYITLVLCSVGGQWKYLDGVYFLQCSITAQAQLPSANDVATREMIWIYPLIPSVTMCYRTEYGAFIFPDLESTEAGAVFGIMIVDAAANADTAFDEDEQSLTDLQQHFLDLLEAVLAGEILILSESQRKCAASDRSQIVSRKIVTAADFIARHLIGGAEKTGEMFCKSTPYIMSKLKAAPADAPPIYSPIQTTVDVARNVSGVAAGVTCWVAGKVGSASMAIGRFLAPHIQTQGAFLLENGLGYNSEEAHSKMEGAFTIAAGALEGFSSVYNGLETSAKILGKSLSTNSVKIIEHKYGPSAANVAAGTFDTLGNAFNVSQNLNYITPKGIARKMVKNTGKAVVIDYKTKARKESRHVPAGVLYPDLTMLKDAQQ